MIRFLPALAVLLFPVLLNAAPAPDARLAAIDAQASYRDTDFAAVYTVVQSKPGQGEAVTVLAMYRRDAADKYVVKILKPASDQGRGILREGDVVRKYNPVERRFDLTTSKEQLRNSNIRLSDFQGASFAADYAVVSEEAAVVGGQKVRLLSLKATNDQVTFPQAKIWVTADNLVLRRADFSLSGQLLRTLAIPKYTAIGRHFVPVNIVIQDELRGATVNGTFQKERTVITIDTPEFKKQGDLTFSQAFLEGITH